jgi:pilus assembly protein CpaD
MPAARKDSMIMANGMKLATLLTLGAALSACATDQRTTDIRNAGLNSVNQPVVQRTDYVIDIAAPGGRVPVSEQERLRAWFDTLRLGYGDRIYVDEAGGYYGSSARGDIAGVASGYGLLLNEGAPMTAGAVQSGTARVIVSRTVANVPGCPNWHGSDRAGATILTSSNYGCSVNSNLAAMVADPNDLVLGQSGSAAGDPDAAAKAVRQYRTAPPTGAQGLPQTKTGGN